MEKLQSQHNRPCVSGPRNFRDSHAVRVGAVLLLSAVGLRAMERTLYSQVQCLTNGLLLWMGISVGKCMALGVGLEGKCDGGNVTRS